MDFKQFIVMDADHTYEIVGAGVDHTGWYKFRLKRSDGKEIKVTRQRLKELRQQGKVKNDPGW